MNDTNVDKTLDLADMDLLSEKPREIRAVGARTQLLSETKSNLRLILPELLARRVTNTYTVEVAMEFLNRRIKESKDVEEFLGVSLND